MRLNEEADTYQTVKVTVCYSKLHQNRFRQVQDWSSFRVVIFKQSLDESLLDLCLICLSVRAFEGKLTTIKISVRIQFSNSNCSSQNKEVEIKNLHFIFQATRLKKLKYENFVHVQMHTIRLD